MTDHRDTQLKALFSEARQELDGREFTSRVMRKARSLRFLLIAAGITAALLVTFSAWRLLAIPLLEFAVLVSQVLTETLFDVGDGWLGLLLLPVNNIASLMVLGAKLVHSLRKKVIGSGLPN